MLVCPWGDHNIVRPHRHLVLGLTPCLILRRAHKSGAPSQVSGLDVASLLNRLVDRQHDDLREARAETSQREQQAYQREKEARAEAYQREKEARDEAYKREQAAKAEALQREQAAKVVAYHREQEARAEVRAMAKAEVLQREKQVRSEVEKEMEIDRLRQKLA